MLGPLLFGMDIDWLDENVGGMINKFVKISSMVVSEEGSSSLQHDID